MAHDNSNNVTVSTGTHEIGDPFPVGETTVSYNATDGAGHMITCTFTVTVADVIDPVVTCPGDNTITTDTGKGTAIFTWPDATATDNVGVTLLESDPPQGSPLPVGDNIITYTAYDAAQNDHMCTFTITVNDIEPPVFSSCPSTVTEVAPLDQAEAVVVWDLPSASDNAIMVTVESLYQTAAVYSLGVTTVIYLATDMSGNQANCTFEIVVLDEQFPMIRNCPSDIMENTATGQNVATSIVWTPPQISDNDPQVMTTNNYADPPADFPVGKTEVVYTAVDRAGNSVNCSFVVSVVDNQPPTYNACPASFSIPAIPDTTTANVTWVPPTAVDNVAVITSSPNYAPNTIFNFGVTVVVYTATDEASNMGKCTFNVTVIDSNAPLLTNCPTDQIFCADLGSFSRSVTWIEPTATDVEGSVTLSSEPKSGDMFFYNDGVPTLVTYAAIDEAGLTASCSFYITIRDCEDPIISCLADITVPGVAGDGPTAVTWQEPTATDNTNQVIVNKTHSPWDTFTADTSPVFVEYIATDPSGNTDVCIFTVTVTPFEVAPTIVNCPADISHFVAPGVTQANIAWTPPTVIPSSASLSESHTPGSAFATGVSTLVTYVATNSLGQTATCTFTVNVIADTVNPVFTNCPSNIARSVPIGQSSLSVSWTHPVATDNSGVVTVSVTHSPGFNFLIQTTTVTYTAVDQFGHSSVCSFTVNVTESTDQLPQITCPSDISRNTDAGLATALVSWPQPTAMDDQGVPIVTCDFQYVANFAIGMNTVTCTATDNNNNKNTCSFVITVIDNENPTLSNCPASFTLTVATVTDRAVANWIPPTASDNSGQYTLVTTLETGQSLLPGQYSVTYSVTDPSGLTASCPTFTVIVQAIGSGCDTNMCANGGLCRTVNNGFTCDCTSLWTGTTCEEDVNECTQTAVIQGCSARGLSCFNQLGGYTCDCPVGFVRAGNSDNCLKGKFFRISFVIIEIFRQPVAFPADLSNPSSVLFLRHQGRLQILLTFVFDHMSGFGHVRVLFFFSGSIGVQVAVTFDSTSTATLEDVQNAFDQGITSGDLVMNSEYKLTPSKTQVIEEVCVAGYCQNGGTCSPTPVTYLSSCTCPSGYSGDRCQSVTVTEPPPVDGLPLEVIIAIAVGGAIALLLIVLMLLCLCYLIRGAGRGKRGYLYDEDYEERLPAETHNSMYGVQFQPRDNNGMFSVPYMASGREVIPLHQLADRSGADYY